MPPPPLLPLLPLLAAPPFSRSDWSLRCSPPGRHHVNAFEEDDGAGGGGGTVVLDTVALLAGVDLGTNMDVGAACEPRCAAPPGPALGGCGWGGPCACQRRRSPSGHCIQLAAAARLPACPPADYQQEQGRGTLTRLVIDTRAGTVAQHRLLDRACEFPSVAPAVVGRPHTHAYMVASRFPGADAWGAPQVRRLAGYGAGVQGQGQRQPPVDGRLARWPTCAP